MSKHRLSPEAKAELDDIWYYVATESGSIEIADGSSTNITSRFLLLARRPYLRPAQGLLTWKCRHIANAEIQRGAGALWTGMERATRAWAAFPRTARFPRSPPSAARILLMAMFRAVIEIAELHFRPGLLLQLFPGDNSARLLD